MSPDAAHFGFVLPRKTLHRLIRSNEQGGGICIALWDKIRLTSVNGTGHH